MKFFARPVIICGLLLLVTHYALVAMMTPAPTRYAIVDNDDRNYVVGEIILYDRPKYQPAWSKRKDYEPAQRRKPIRQIPLEEEIGIPAGD